MNTLTPKRYEIYYANLNPSVRGEIKKIRPVVIISQDAMNRNLDTVVICPLTRKLHFQWRSRMQIKCSGQDAEIAVDQIRTISKNRLKQKVDKLSTEESLQLRQLITDMYGE